MSEELKTWTSAEAIRMSVLQSDTDADRPRGTPGREGAKTILAVLTVCCTPGLAHTMLGPMFSSLAVSPPLGLWRMPLLWPLPF